MSSQTSTLNQFSKLSKNDYPYLRFDAFSMKDLINKKLSEDSSLSDHIYEGSNISTLVDIVSVMFESLMFNLNQAASESMISDANIYSNLSRLVKFIGYSPNGYKASTVNVTAFSKSTDLSFLVVPKYSTITIDDIDNFGNNVSFSTTDYYYINANSSNNIKLVNGIWKHYPSTFTAIGEKHEKFILDGIGSSGDESEFIAFPYIDVYVKRPLGNDLYETISYSAVTDGIYLDDSDDSILTSKDNKFALRLNEDKKYEIEFGDGVHGSMLKSGDIIHIVYLQSNNTYGEITSNKINNKQFKVGIDGISESIDGRNGRNLLLVDVLELDSNYNNSIYAYSENNPYRNPSIIGEYRGESDSLYETESTKTFFYGCTNPNKSSTPSQIETVEQIRTNAPNHFKRAGRINTENDFVTVIKERFYSDIIDCIVMNNYKYRHTFNKWLWQLGYDKLNNPRKWLNPTLNSVGTYGYKYADATDSNNVYIWLKQESEVSSIGNSIIESIKDECPLTANPVIVQAVDVKFAICAGFTKTLNKDGTEMTLRDFYNGSRDKETFIFNDRGQNRLEIMIAPETNISSTIIKNRVLEIFRNFFSSSVMNIGSTVSIGNLENNILGINGVERIRTVFRRLKDDGTFSNTDIIRVSGVSLAHWNESVVAGYDIEKTNANVTLESFQYPIYNDYSSILNQIDIIVDGSLNVSD